MLHITQVAWFDIKVDEEKYTVDVGQMWEDYEEGRTKEKPPLESGYGSCWEAVENIGFKLSNEMNLDLETNGYDNSFKLFGGDATDYKSYHRNLAERLQFLFKWVSL